MHIFSTITRRFIGFLFLISIVPLVIVGTLSYQVAYQVLRQEVTASNKQLVTNQRDYLDLQLQQIESLIYNLSGVEEVINAINPQISQDNTYLELATQARIGYILNSYTNLDGLVSIDIYSQGGKHFHVGDTLDVSSLREDVKQRIYQQAQRARDRRIIWIGVEDNVNANSKDHKVVTAAKILTQATRANSNSSEPQEAGILLVNYSLDYFYEYFSQIDLGRGGYLIIVDSAGRILYHPNKSHLGQQVNTGLLRSLSAQDSAYLGSIDGQQMLINHQTSTVSGWQVIGFIPMRELLAGTIPIRLTTLITLCLAFSIVLLAAWQVSQKIVSPIQEITQHFKSLQSGTLDQVSILPEERLDEIGELSRGFNSLVHSLSAKQAIESALQESEQRYFLALQGANDGIWDWDLITNKVHFSARWKDMVGYPEENDVSNPDIWLKLIHTDDIAHVVAKLAEHFKGNLPHFESEHRLFSHATGGYIWVLVRGMVTRDENYHPTRIAGSMTDITTRKATEEKLRHDALYDTLTNLPNRAYFNQRIEEIIYYARQTEESLSAVILLDLDRFKVINDSLGHAAGDYLLFRVSQKLLNCIRKEDFVARLGGDEFAILLIDITDIEYAQKIADRIQQDLSHSINLDGHEISVSASLGIAMIKNGQYTPEELLRDADTALYHAKDLGRAGFVIFDESMHAMTLEALQLEAQLKHALSRQEFALYYQPIVSVQTRKLVAVEALIRWFQPEQGYISPAKFIPLAEEIGIISSIGEWVLYEACRQGRMWQDAGYSNLKVSVNISARQLRPHTFTEVISHALRTTGCLAQQLQLEITESTAMADANLTNDLFREIQAMGVRIVIDDFGTSYSSLGYLRKFPFNGIKIDRSFIQDVPENSDAVAITSAILAIAHILGLEVTAEGVETAAQLAFLATHKCDYMQGYLLGKPTKPENLSLM
jgi:diguanylate cyclase (GGDEF)-like protein/PAS domain S-box-containing protein